MIWYIFVKKLDRRRYYLKRKLAFPLMRVPNILKIFRMGEDNKCLGRQRHPEWRKLAFTERGMTSKWASFRGTRNL